MMKFNFLISIIFSHKYYNECIPSEISEIEPRRTNRVALGGSRYPFKQMGRNQYALIGDREELLDHLSTFPDGLNLESQAHSKDPNFSLYTQSPLPEELNDSDIQLSVIDNRLNRLNVVIHVIKELLETKYPIQKEIHHHTKEAYWDSVSIPRNPENASMDTFMEDNGPENINFKNPKQIRFTDKDVFRVSTEYPIKTKEESYYQKRSERTGEWKSRKRDT